MQKCWLSSALHCTQSIQKWNWPKSYFVSIGPTDATSWIKVGHIDSPTEKNLHNSANCIQRDRSCWANIVLSREISDVNAKSLITLESLSFSNNENTFNPGYQHILYSQIVVDFDTSQKQQLFNDWKHYNIVGCVCAERISLKVDNAEILGSQ